ncbi:MAG: restriction endonuclease subunit S [Mameliella sp.]|nr:restriction endonuclease subunit S [Mameliella sp.]
MSWPEVALKSVADIQRSGIAPDEITDGTDYLGLEHVASGGEILSRQSVAAGELASTKFTFGPSHVLYGKLRPYLGKIALPDFEGVCSTDILPVSPGPELDRRYLAYCLRQPRMIEHANKLATGANLPRLSPKALAEFPIPLPPLEEQKRIAGILDQAAELCRLRTRALEKLNTLGQAIFHEMFGQAVRDRKFWPIFSLGDCVENCDAKRVPVKQAERDKRSGPYPYYGSVGVIDDIDDFLFEGEHLLISEDGKHLQTRTRPVACLTSGKFWVNNHAHVLKNNGAADLVFLKYLIDTTSLEHHITGIDQIKLNRKSLDRIPVLLPPMDLQRSFRNRVESVEANIGLNASTGSALVSLFASLQYRAFRGQL